MWKKFLTITMFMTFVAGTIAQTGSHMRGNNDLRPGYWPLEKSQPIIDKMQTIRLAPDLGQLSEGERKAVTKLLEVGQIFQRLYEGQRHKQALSSSQLLLLLDKRMGSPATQN